MRQMMTSIVQTTVRPAEPVNEIPATVLLIGKKRASEYLPPALFRIGSFSRLEIRAKGSLSIVTAVDVAELVKRNVDSLSQSISIGTDEIVVDGFSRRVSYIEITLTRNEPEPAAPVVEIDPAAIAERISPPEKPKVAKKKAVAKKKRATKKKSSD